jgi:hypothetical protein
MVPQSTTLPRAPILVIPSLEISHHILRDEYIYIYRRRRFEEEYLTFTDAAVLYLQNMAA